MIDLHAHSSMSDGSYTPEALVDFALETGLGALALTDHDSLAGIERAAARARGTRLTLVPGVELEIACDTGEFHLLGLGLDGDRAPLEATLERVRRDRHERNEQPGRPAHRGRHPGDDGGAGRDLGRRHREPRALRAPAGAQGRGEAHGRRLRPVPREGEAVLRAAPHAGAGGRRAPRSGARGGIAVAAHPLSLGLAGPALRQFLAHARDAGVAGIEAWHPNATVRDCRQLERLAGSLGMGVTAGSDFHGLNLPQRRLGHTAGGLPIDDRFLAVLRYA